jgi:hypothetical protein
MLYPIHALQIVAMGMLASDLTELEGVARACEEERRWEFMVIGLPLHLPGGTGSPWNPIAIFDHRLTVGTAGAWRGDSRSEA